MNRLRLVLAALAVLFGAASPSATAVNTVAFTFAVDCADPDGTSSDDIAPIQFPTGTYQVTIAGACLYGAFNNYAVSTPCSGPTGSVPCATVNNIPAACMVSTGGVATENCGMSTVAHCWAYRVEVDGQCLAFDNAGFINHTAQGPIRARFLDCCHSDNVGVFLVTVVWTPL